MNGTTQYRKQINRKQENIENPEHKSEINKGKIRQEKLIIRYKIEH